MTTSAHGPDGTHPIAWFATRVHAVLDDLAEAAAWSMTAEEQRAALLALSRAEARISELRLRVLAAADRNDIAASTAATSTAAWLAFHTRANRSNAHADLRLARALDSTFPQTRAALAAGNLNQAQAQAIVHAVEQLPEDVAPALRQQAEKQLVHDAGDHDAKALRMLGRRVFEVVDPEAADLEEGRRLEREERTAARATYLHLCDNGDGTYTGRFKIPTLHAAMLRKALHALTAPAHMRSSAAKSASPTEEPRFTRPEQLGHAFCELLERFPANRLPKAGGASATVLVLLDYEKLLSGLWAAHLDTGEAISAGEARRLACSSDIIPVVYRRAVDGRSVVLDMGRRRRLHSELQRIGLDVQDRGCTAVGCDRPAAWCHAHHVVPWAEGGGTSVEMGRLLCGFHHHRAHSERYHTIPRADGKLLFHRRT